MPTRKTSYALIQLAIAAAYVATALLGFQFASINDNVTLIWIPAGLALAVLLHYGYHYWPAIFMGAAIANHLAGSDTVTALGIAVGNTAEALIACWLVDTIFKSRLNNYDHPKQILGLAFAVVCGALLAALNGSALLSIRVFQHWDNFYDTFTVWWLGDVMGMLLIAPTLLIWARSPIHYSTRLLIKNSLLLTMVVLSLLITFTGIIQHMSILVEPGHQNHQYPLAFLPMAALLISAFFGSPRLISLTIISASIVIIFGTSNGHGPFAREDFNESLGLIYLFIAVSSLCTYSISYLVRQRDLAQDNLRIGSDRLDFVMDSTEDGIWDLNIETDELYVSPTFKKMLGFREDETLGFFDLWKKRIHPDDVEHTLKHLGEHLAGRSALFQSEHRLRRKNGDYLWVLGRGKGVKRNASGQALRVVGTCINLAEQKHREAELMLASRLIQSTPEGIMITSPEHVILEVNPAFSATTGYSRDEAIGQNPNILSSGRHDAAFYQKLWAEVDSEGFWQGEIWNRRKNGEIFPEWLHIFSIKSSSGEVVQYAAIFSDFGKNEQLKNKLHNVAYYDTLTGLPNRELLIDRLNVTILQSRKTQQQLAILLIDLDRFKVINETLGHSVGDALLQEVARILNTISTEGDTVARMGGDEFIILMADIEHADAVARVAEKIIENFTRPFLVGEHELHFTCSIGIAIFPQDGNSTEDLIKNADTSMYQAKEIGFNRYRFYHSDMSADFQQRFLLESQLRYAVFRNELFLEYQPQHSLRDGSIVGMEALVRWNHPTQGIIPPFKFISIAEESGLIVPMGNWILKQAIEDTLSIRKQLPEGFRVAVNLSVLQVQQSGFVDFVSNTIKASGLPSHYLELEITESLLMKNIDETLDRLKQLDDAGIKIAIDDFGTGYSSLSYLSKFPISKLKIDKSFIDNICVNEEDAGIASSIIALGHNLHMKVIAEGVEDADQRTFLQNQGCDEVQGYFYSRPLPFEQFIEYLNASTTPQSRA